MSRTTKAAQEAAAHRERMQALREFREAEQKRQIAFRLEFRRWVAEHDQGDGLYGRKAEDGGQER